MKEKELENHLLLRLLSTLAVFKGTSTRADICRTPYSVTTTNLLPCHLFVNLAL